MRGKRQVESCGRHTRGVGHGADRSAPSGWVGRSNESDGLVDCAGSCKCSGGVLKHQAAERGDSAQRNGQVFRPPLCDEVGGVGAFGEGCVKWVVAECGEDPAQPAAPNGPRPESGTSGGSCGVSPTRRPRHELRSLTHAYRQTELWIDDGSHRSARTPQVPGRPDR